jgi:hypothetical protein
VQSHSTAKSQQHALALVEAITPHGGAGKSKHTHKKVAGVINLLEAGTGLDLDHDGDVAHAGAMITIVVDMVCLRRSKGPR